MTPEPQPAGAPTPRRPASLSVIVPLRDEEGGVAALADRARTFNRDDCLVRDDGLDSAPAPIARSVQWVLVDDGSTDRTHDRLVEHFGENGDALIVRHEVGRGLSAALATGREAATGEYIAWLDADLTYDPAVLADLARDLDRGLGDVGIASCYHPDGDVAGVPSWRLWLSRTISRAYRWVARQRTIHTFTCMVRVYRREVLDACAPQRGGFLGVTEVLLRALASGYRVVERPATLHRRRVGQSKMRVLRVGCGHLGLLWAAWRGHLGKAAPAVQRVTTERVA